MRPETGHEWLMVAGARAQYKGAGTINGDGDYGFLPTAIDGQVSGGGGDNRFRVKIRDKSTGETVYDNQSGAGDNNTLNDATNLGGSIVIHAGGRSGLPRADWKPQHDAASPCGEMLVTTR